MAEHYLYFPLIGICLIVSRSVSQLFTKDGKGFPRNLFLFCFCVVLILFGGLVIQRNRDYGSELRLFRQTVTHAPQSAKAHNNLGSFLMSQRRLEEAQQAFETSLRLNPRDLSVWVNLGTLYKEKGQYDQAVQIYERILQETPEDLILLHKLAIVYAEMGREEAEELFREVMQKDPSFIDAYFNLGSYYWKKNELGKALAIWEAGLLRAPHHPILNWWVRMAQAKRVQGVE